MNDETLPNVPNDGGLFTPTTPGADLPPVVKLGRDLSGTTLGGCRLVRKIAEGGMGEIYEGVQTALDRKVAVKLVSQQLAGRQEFLQRFEREAKAAAALNHPNVVHVHDFGQAGGQLYLVMEFVEGEDYSSHVTTRGKLPVPEALAVIEQAARALKAALEKSIIHRDIKPANLLRTRDGLVKISDLGLAKMLGEETGVTLTGTGQGLGSPHFLAPEQADDASRADHRADIYSLGITLLFLLTGKRPFEGASSYSIVLAHASKPIPSGAELGTELPDAVEALIRKMTAKRPEERHANYDALLADLELVKAGVTPRPKFSARSGRVQLVAAALVILLTAGLTVFLFQRDDEVAAPPAPRPSESTSSPRPAEGFAPDSDSGGKRPPPKKGGRRGPPNTFQSKFGVIQFGPGRFRMEHTPIPTGPLETMFKAADEFAKNNSGQYVNVIHAYRQVEELALGTPFENKARQKSDDAIASHKTAVNKLVAELEVKMADKARSGDFQGVVEVWREFPADLYVPEPDMEDQINAALQRHLPADFRVKAPPP